MARKLPATQAPKGRGQQGIMQRASNLEIEDPDSCPSLFTY